MDIILVPGFWLDASTWSEVTSPLVAAGHRVHPLTLPGLESVEAPRTGIGLRDHIDAVVKSIDAIDGQVILVGHSGGGAIIHGAVDARPDQVTRAVYVDSGPLAEGGATAITCEFSSAQLATWIEAGHQNVSELARIRDVEYVDLPTGHWPQFTRPAELGAAILAAVERTS